MVCEASPPCAARAEEPYLSVPSSSGWCVKPTAHGHSRGVFRLSVPSSSGWCVKRWTLLIESESPAAFQFPLHRDGV